MINKKSQNSEKQPEKFTDDLESVAANLEKIKQSGSGVLHLPTVLYVLAVELRNLKERFDKVYND